MTKELLNNRFAKNFMKLFSATFLAQIITIVTSPILTRIYTPEEFGVYSFYMALLTISLVYTTGRYEFAIATLKSDRESLGLMRLIVTISFFISSLIGILLVVMEYLSFNLLNENNFLIYFIPFTLFAMGIAQGLNYYLNRFNKFNLIASGRVVQSISNVGISIVLGSTPFHKIGMIAANFLSITITNIYNSKYKGLFKQLINIRLYSFKEMKKLALKYKEYPLYNSHSAFFDTLSLQAPIILISRFFSETILGLYSLTIKIAGLPISLISMAVAQVYLSELAERERNKQPIKLIVYKAAKVLAVIGIVPTLFLLVSGPFLFEVVFGEEWKKAGEFLRILVFSYYMKFIVSPLSVVFFVKGKIKLLSKVQICRAFSTFVTLVAVSVIAESITIFILAYTIHEILFYLIYGFFILKISNEMEENS